MASNYSRLATRFRLSQAPSVPRVLTCISWGHRKPSKTFADLIFHALRRNVSHTGALRSIGLERWDTAHCFQILQDQKTNVLLGPNIVP